MTLLAILSFLTGISLGMINEFLIGMYWTYYEGFDYMVLFLLFMVDVLFLPITVFGTKWTFEAKSHGNKWKPWATALAIIVSLILITTVVGASIIKITKTPVHYSYEINTYPDGDGQYFMYLPLPLDGTGNVAKFMTHLKINEGSGNFSVVHTIKGWALNLSSKGHLELRVSGSSEEIPFNSVSLKNSTPDKRFQETYLVYYHVQSNQSMRFMQTIDRAEVGHYEAWRINGKIEPMAWSLVEGTHEYHIV
jgi:hypothetical protein